VIAGDGEGADAKARLFEGSPAAVVRLNAAEALDPSAYAGADLIFVASYDGALVAAAAAAARATNAPLNVVDHPELSDFHTPAIIDRGQVVAAIGTAGAAPLLAALLRAELEARLPEGAGRLAALLGARREPLRAAFPDLPARRAFLRSLLAGPAAEAARTGEMDVAARLIDAAIAGGWSAVGRISLIPTPTRPDLISLRALRALNIADVVVVGAGAGPIVAAHARRDAEHWTWSRANDGALAAEAAAGRLIVAIDEALAPDLASRLLAAGAVVETLAAAPEA
jgi:precorrin-2 dehydrogenase/sirohydrochlorin ferrochelatase